MRRDLRLHDHHALNQALQECDEVLLVFVFDQNIISKLANPHDRRLNFIYQSLLEIEKKLNTVQSSLLILHGDPKVLIPKLAMEKGFQVVYSNRDYEPYAKDRDQKVKDTLKKNKIEFKQFKDHVIFEQSEVYSKPGHVYKVFTPFKRKWLENFLIQDQELPNYKCSLKKITPWKNTQSILNKQWCEKLHLDKNISPLTGGTPAAQNTLKKFSKNIGEYHKLRDFPNENGTSLISTHIRHGTISIRDLVRFSQAHKGQGSQIWLSELIWREFYQIILDAYPMVVNGPFKQEYGKIKWSKDKKIFNAWVNGSTGYPIIDATMIHFKATGLMHNRLRMVVANFLCKILLIDWQMGEEYFAQNLLDFDLAANNGGWQWSSSTGCDAQPYFRIFNPYTQSEKFDPDGVFIKTHLPVLNQFPSKYIHAPHLAPIEVQKEANCLIGQNYPMPMVDYKVQRSLALDLYSIVKAK